MYLVYGVFFSLQAFISFCALVVVCLYSLNYAKCVQQMLPA